MADQHESIDLRSPEDPSAAAGHSWFPGPPPPIYSCSLTPELVAKAREELQEKPEWRLRDVQALRDMILKVSLCAFFAILTFIHNLLLKFQSQGRIDINYISFKTVKSRMLSQILKLDCVFVEHIFTL